MPFRKEIQEVKVVLELIRSSILNALKDRRGNSSLEYIVVAVAVLTVIVAVLGSMFSGSAGIPCGQ
jgi:hypothetical protein